MDLGCAKLASLIKGKNPREIRETFGVEGDFTPEQRKAVMDKFPYLRKAEEVGR